MDKEHWIAEYVTAALRVDPSLSAVTLRKAAEAVYPLLYDLHPASLHFEVQIDKTSPPPSSNDDR